LAFVLEHPGIRVSGLASWPVYFCLKAERIK
jgi:hypothetical protein